MIISIHISTYLLTLRRRDYILLLNTRISSDKRKYGPRLARSASFSDVNHLWVRYDLLHLQHLRCISSKLVKNSFVAVKTEISSFIALIAFWNCFVVNFGVLRKFSGNMKFQFYWHQWNRSLKIWKRCPLTHHTLRSFPFHMNTVVRYT